MGRCQRPGCTGSYDDGYCDVCGLAPPQAPAPTNPTEILSLGASGPGSGPSGPGSGPSGSGSGPSGAGSGPSGPTGATRTTGGRTARRGGLGAGLVHVPPVPYRDPAEAVLSDPSVAEHKRFCRNGHKVGRSRGGRPGLTDGFCTQCRAPFSFSPKLVKGDLVAGQYEVLGCLAHGGLGWVYLARDRNVEGRWVVLKGLIDAGDADAQAAAVAERRFLAEVAHPSIVKIYNFVQHLDRRSGASVGYIVMEYVGGQSLKEIRQTPQLPGEPARPLPLPQVLAYALEVLPALGYLHSRGLLYCDLKPDNVIQSEEQLRLIDLGGVCRADDVEGALWGTIGYQAPEVGELGPSVASDVYTVGRMMAVLSFDFPRFTTEFAHRLLPRDQVEVFAAHESYHRLLLRATHLNPRRRFESAEAMAEQVEGVLREVLASADGLQRPAPSALFGPEVRVAELDVDGRDAPPLDHASAALALPAPLVDPADPHAGLLATVSAMGPAEVLQALSAVSDPSVETRLRCARAHIELGETDRASAELDTVESQAAGDWRCQWYRGLAALVTGAFPQAYTAFDAVYGGLPGEAAPKLALATADLGDGVFARSAQRYEAVWRTDHSYVSAAFGLARARARQDDASGAAAALESVPQSSRHCVAAQLAAVRTRVRARQGQDPLSADFFEAAGRMERLDLDAERRARITVEVLQAGLDWVLAGRPGPDNEARDLLLGHPLEEDGLRFGLERAYRTLARLASTAQERVALVDQANEVRPRTWV